MHSSNNLQQMKDNTIISMHIGIERKWTWKKGDTYLCAKTRPWEINWLEVTLVSVPPKAARTR